MKKLISLFLSAALLLSLCACGGPSPEQIAAENYLKATELLDSGNYAEALELLRALGDYEDAPALRKSAAYALAVDYIKKNGSALKALEASDAGDFPYGIKEQAAAQSFNFIAVDENDQLVFGTGRDTSDHSIGTIYCMWSYWMTLAETSNLAETTFWQLLIASYNDIDVQTIENGSDSVDITAYTEATEIDMDITANIIDVNGNEKTEGKNLSSMFTSEVHTQITQAPFAAESILADAGVSLGDLGFAALDEVPAEGDTATQEDTSEPEEESEVPQSETAKPSTGGVQGDVIELTTEDGMAEIKYAGYEYIPAGVLTDETIDLSKVIVVFMDYTNHREDEPSQMQGDFWYRVFQNGVELDRNFCSYYSDKYAPFEDNYKEVMMGGTITAGNFFLLEDDSPITIVANEQGSSDNKQSMTVELN